MQITYTSSSLTFGRCSFQFSGIQLPHCLFLEKKKKKKNSVGSAILLSRFKPTMPALLNPSYLILHQCHHHPRRFATALLPFPRTLLSLLPGLNLSSSFSIPPFRAHSTASAQTQSLDNAGADSSVSISSPSPVQPDYSSQKIDVNPPKGTRDFTPEDMRLRNWLFNNFKEV